MAWLELAPSGRSRVGDFDLDGSTVLLRERKQVQGKKTTRRVPLSAFIPE
jgi:hypothetical protein